MRLDFDLSSPAVADHVLVRLNCESVSLMALEGGLRLQVRVLTITDLQSTLRSLTWTLTPEGGRDYTAR